MDVAVTIFTPDDRLYADTLIWRKAIATSLSRLNAQDIEEGIIVDLGGGRGPLAPFVDRRRFRYVVVDRVASPLMRCDQELILADMAAMPFADDSIDMALSISTAQYVDRAKVFAECHRVLRPGAILALHENGPANPFILAARFGRRIAALFSRKTRDYLGTIQTYYRPEQVPAGFEAVYRSASGILSPLSLLMEQCRIPFARRLAAPLERWDDHILARFPRARRLAFLNVVHLRKVDSTQARSEAVRR